MNGHHGLLSWKKANEKSEFAGAAETKWHKNWTHILVNNQPDALFRVFIY